jgi:hypothetical protein
VSFGVGIAEFGRCYGGVRVGIGSGGATKPRYDLACLFGNLFLNMRCLPTVTLLTDRPIWVSRRAFFECFDQRDFHCRECTDVTSAYLSAWFQTPEEGITRFILPTFMWVADKTQFISGRHRTAVLLPHLDELPIAFTTVGAVVPPLDFLSQVTLRSLSLQEAIDLPNLPIVDNLQ